MSYLLISIFNYRISTGHFHIFSRTFSICPIISNVRLKAAEIKEKLPDIVEMSAGRPALTKRTFFGGYINLFIYPDLSG